MTQSPVTTSPQTPLLPGEPGRSAVGSGGTGRRLGEGGAHHPGDEVRAVLRRRLCLLTPLFVLAHLFSLTRGHLPSDEPLAGNVGLALQLAVAAITLALLIPLLSSLRLSLPQLRRLELLLFGLAALSFAWLQCLTLYEAWLVKTANPRLGPSVVWLAVGASAARWVLLVICYGAVIPNTVRRCAAILASLTVIPLMIAGGAVAGQPTLLPAFGRLVAVLAAAVALGLFACRRLYRLPAQALESEMVGPYQLRQRLRTGGMGEVHLAEHVSLGRPCAVKLIRPPLARDPRTRERFEREAQVMASLAHPNVVAVYDAGRAEDGTCYYVMEYLAGLSLEELVAREGPLPPGRVVHFLSQVCEALRAAHALGLLHLDIKPSNIVACRAGGGADLVKLVDFGLVQGIASTPDLGEESPLGSPPYMSPEQAAGQVHPGPPSDVYSLGGVAYFLLTGSPPFSRDTALQMLLAHAWDPITPPADLRPDLPSDLEQVVLRCLEKDPDRRFPDPVSLASALGACTCAGTWTHETAAAWWERRQPLAPGGCG